MVRHGIIFDNPWRDISADDLRIMISQSSGTTLQSIGVVLRLHQKVIQIFESVRLHSRDFAGNRECGQD
jgi:hypothetical protein